MSALVLVGCCLIHGQESRAAATTLTADTDADVIIEGHDGADKLGQSVASIGDFNGDGVEDIVVGANGDNNNPSALNGRAFIFYGPITGINPLESDADADVILDGEAVFDDFGERVASAGDFNNDGLDDVIVGGLWRNDTPHSAYIFFGRDTGSTQLILGALADADVIITRPALDKNFSISVGSAGDFNDDGVDDVIVGASGTATDDPGSAYIFYGRTGLTSQLQLQDSDADVVLTGRSVRGSFGVSVAPVGDFNGDAIDDVIVGAFQDWVPGSRGGSAFVFFGRPHSGSQLQLNAATDAGVILNANSAQDQFGTSVSGAGDFVGDGNGDVIVGAWSDTNTDSDAGAGRAYVFRGRDTGGQQLTVGADDADVIIDGEEANDFFGRAVGGGGDFNNDGMSDVIVGGPDNVGSDPGTGKAYIFFGHHRCQGSIDAADANLILRSQATGDYLGDAVALGADLNNDGMSDALIGAEFDQNSLGHTQAGRAFVVNGDVSIDILNVTACPASSVNPVSPAGETLLSVQAFDSLGHDVSYLWQSDCSSWATTDGEFSSNALRNPTWRPPANATGGSRDCNISVTVADGSGLAETVGLIQAVSDGPAPHTMGITQAPAGSPNPIPSARVVNLTVQATDSDISHNLNYSWQANCSGWSSSNGIFNDSSLRNPEWRAPENNTGSSQPCSIEVTVDDGAGGLSQTASFTQAVTQPVGGPGTLLVVPAEDFSSSGPSGGPFIPASKDYLLVNDGGAPVSYMVSKSSEPWFELSPSSTGGHTSSGILFPGERATVTALITSPLFDDSGTVTFTNMGTGAATTVTVSVSVSLPPLFGVFVTPVEGFHTVGAVGTTTWFPPEKYYVIENRSPSSADIRIDSSIPSIFGVSVNLGPFETINHSLRIATYNASRLAPGVHTGTVTYINESVTPESIIATRQVSLTVTDPLANSPSPQVITPPNVTAEATGPFTSAVDLRLHGPAIGWESSDCTSAGCSQLLPIPHWTGPFPLGNSTVRWGVVNAFGKVASAPQFVSIVDSTAPVFLEVPADIVIDASQFTTTVDLGTPIVSDLVDASVHVTNNIGGTNTVVDLDLGFYTVVWRARDDSGNETTAEQTVFIRDTVPPVLTIGEPDITVYTTSTPVVVPIYDSITISDNISVYPELELTNNAPNGLLFDAGVTNVTWTLTDGNGHTVNKTQKITVYETQAKLMGAEVIQASQDLKNSAKLIEGKTTVVRAYFEPAQPGLSTGNLPEVAPRLEAWRGNTRIGGPIAASNHNADVTARYDIINHRNTSRIGGTSLLSSAAIFEIPDSWTDDGQVTFKFLPAANGFQAFTCNEAIGSLNGSCELSVNFLKDSRLDVKLFRVEFKNEEATRRERAEAETRLRASFPVGNPKVAYAKITVSDWVFFGDEPSLTIVNSALSTARAKAGCGDIDCEQQYYGVMPSSWGDEESGSGEAFFDVASGVAAPGNAYAGYVIAHEIGHLFDQQHTEGPGALPICGSDGFTDPFPYVFKMDHDNNNSTFKLIRATMGPPQSSTVLATFPTHTLFNEEDVVIGWDSSGQSNDPNSPWGNYISTEDTWELMSYCKPAFKWPSIYTYNRIRTDLVATYGTVVSAASAEKSVSRDGQTTLTLAANADVEGIAQTGGGESYMIIQGYIQNETGEFVLAPVVMIDGAALINRMKPGDHLLQLLGDEGQVLEEISFAPYDMSNGLAGERGPNESYFRFPIPYDEAIRGFNILNAGQIVVSRMASNNAPSVEILYPNDGEVLAGDEVELLWQGFDRDRKDELTYSVLYSADNGGSWETYAVDFRESSLRVELSEMAGSETALLKVQVSDGFLTGEDVSDGVFVVPNSAPEISILLPHPSQFYVPEQLVIHKAISLDKEDGELTDAAITWSSSTDGFLGNGHHLNVTASSLSPGKHVITATALDGDGGVGTDSVDIKVFGGPMPPLVMANLSVTPDVIWPPNHKMVPVEISVNAHTASDRHEPVCGISEIASNEPEDGRGDGHTEPDVVLTGPMTADVRAERSGGKQDLESRIYTVTIECTVDDGESIYSESLSAEIVVPENGPFTR